MDYYYTDANDTHNQLIALHQEPSDVYRDDCQQKKFTDCLRANMAGRPSEFSIMLSQLTHDTTELLAKQTAETARYTDNLRFSPNIHSAVRELGYALEHLNREFITGLLRNGRPDKSNFQANKKVVEELLVNARDCLDIPVFKHLTVAFSDRRFFEKLFAWRAESMKKFRPNVVGKQDLGEAQMDQYIADTGLSSYFSGDSVSGHLEPDREHLTTQLSASHSPKDLPQLWAYNDLYDGLQEIYQKATELLQARTAEFCQFNADELNNFPKIIPVKCKLLVKNNVHTISGVDKLDSEDLVTLLQSKYKALKIPSPGRNSNREKLLVNDPALIKIVDANEAKADQGRG